MATTKPRKGRVVATCHGCGEPIIEGTGWRRLPKQDDARGYDDFHHLERSEPADEFTPDGQHQLRTVEVVSSCIPKRSTGAKRTAVA